jgi:hypothetical protein
MTSLRKSSPNDNNNESTIIIVKKFFHNLFKLWTLAYVLTPWFFGIS